MSTAARKLDDCTKFSHSVAPYVDGELDPCHAVDMEAHVLACAPCAERIALIRATRQSIKRRCASRANEALRARITATLCQERARAAELQEAESRVAEEPLGPKLIRLRYAVGLAAAAGVVFAMGLARHARSQEGNLAVHGESESQPATMASLDAMIDDLVSLHANPYPPETTNQDDLQHFGPLIGVNVRRPALQPFGASFTGARLHSFSPATQRAAMLQTVYTFRGTHRVTMYVFNASAVSVHPKRLAPRIEPEKRVVYVGNVNGFSVAAGAEHGVGYAIASDLGDDENAQVALAAMH